MKFALVLLSIYFTQISFSQEDGKEPSKESRDYHEARQRITTPPYGLATIKSLIKDIKYVEGEDGVDGEMKLDDKKYQKLSLKEKFTYHMIHAESYSQVCDALPMISDEHKKIFANLLDAYDEYQWSKRQTDFFAGNKDSVIAYMSESIKRTGKVGLNFKRAILEINAIEMVPLLIETYKKNKAQKDLDILTVFLLLMEENKYEPFIKSASHKKLYDDMADYQAYLTHNKANEDLIIQRATDFYNASKK